MIANNLDPIGLLERSYRPHADPCAWMHQMTGPVTEGLDDDRLGSYSFFLTPQGPLEPHFVPREQSQHGADWFLTSLFEVYKSVPAIDRSLILRSFQVPGIFAMDQQLGYVPESPFKDQLGYRDSLAVVVHTPEGPPAVFVTLCARLVHIGRSQSALWRRVATHLAAGCRLSGRKDSLEAEDVECILTDSGEAVHASGPATNQGSRELLRQAVKNVDFARTKRGRADPLEALDLWQGLFAGRWSLVDHFDTDGRRFLLARRNEPNARGPSALSLRQRQVLFYLAAGCSNKEIGYALGLAEGTIATHVRGALRAVGVKSRAEWIRLAAEMQTAAEVEITQRP